MKAVVVDPTTTSAGIAGHEETVARVHVPSGQRVVVVPDHVAEVAHLFRHDLVDVEEEDLADIADFEADAARVTEKVVSAKRGRAKKAAAEASSDDASREQTSGDGSGDEGDSGDGSDEQNDDGDSNEDESRE